jgi:hypothetical protein
MPRKATEITLTTEQKQQLEKIVLSHSAERRLVERAQIILECTTGKQNQEIASSLTCSNQKAQPFKWRRREVKGSQIKNTIAILRN